MAFTTSSCSWVIPNWLAASEFDTRPAGAGCGFCTTVSAGSDVVVSVGVASGTLFSAAGAALLFCTAGAGLPNMVSLMKVAYCMAVSENHSSDAAVSINLLTTALNNELKFLSKLAIELFNATIMSSVCFL